MSAVLTRRSLSTPQGVSLLILLSVPSVGPRLSRTSRFPCARSVDDETKRRRRCRRPRQKCFERARTAQSDGHDDDDNGGTAHDRVRRTRFWGGGERKREKEGKKKKNVFNHYNYAEPRNARVEPVGRNNDKSETRTISASTHKRTNRPGVCAMRADDSAVFPGKRATHSVAAMRESLSFRYGSGGGVRPTRTAARPHISSAARSSPSIVRGGGGVRQ